MIKNFKLRIEYDGTTYAGWQRQKDHPTIQETIEKALKTVTRQSIVLLGSGRTDAGVHALAQIASFRCETRMTSDQFKRALNSLLPEDIVIHAQRWRQDPSLLRSYTGEALDAFGLEIDAAFVGAAAAAVTPVAPPQPRKRSSRRTAKRSRPR